MSSSAMPAARNRLLTPENYSARAVYLVNQIGFCGTYFIRETALKPYGVWRRSHQYRHQSVPAATLLKSYNCLEGALRHIRVLVAHADEARLVPRPLTLTGEYHASNRT